MKGYEQGSIAGVQRELWEHLDCGSFLTECICQIHPVVHFKLIQLIVCPFHTYAYLLNKCGQNEAYRVH
jgi:hypothetical protein